MEKKFNLNKNEKTEFEEIIDNEKKEINQEEIRDENWEIDNTEIIIKNELKNYFHH